MQKRFLHFHMIGGKAVRSDIVMPVVILAVTVFLLAVATQHHEKQELADSQFTNIIRTICSVSDGVMIYPSQKFMEIVYQGFVDNATMKKVEAMVNEYNKNCSDPEICLPVRISNSIAPTR